MSRTATAVAGSLLAAVALGLSACSPILTDIPYASSDGVRVTWSDSTAVKAENVLLLSSAEGADARLVGGLTNTTTDDVEVTLGFAEAEPVVIEVAAGSTVLLDGSQTRDVVLPDAPVPPGSTATMVFSTPELGLTTVEIPVLDGKLSEYTELVP